MSTGQSRWDEGQSRWDERLSPARYAASKVPLITIYFWIIKLLTTAMGEAASDYMVRTIDPVIAVCFGFVGFAIAMVLQLRAKAYVAWIYWLAVAMVAVFGTQAADVLHIKFHVPYVASTTFYGIVLIVIFTLWYLSERTLSIHSIRTPRRELFYWATVLATFALGTATGDMTAKTLNLGYLASGIWFSVAFAIVALAHWKLGLNPIVAFWVCYVLTRPVGASFADYVAFPHSVGGLDVGHGPVALMLTFVIAILVGYLMVTRKDVEDPRQAEVPRSRSRHRRGVPGPGSYPASRSVPPQPAQQYPGQQYPGEQYPGEQYRGQPHPGQQYPGQQPHPGQRYRGQQYPERQYPEQGYPERQYPERQYPEQGYPERQYPERQYPERQYPEQGYPERQYPERQYPEQPRPGQRRPAPPRSGPPRSGSQGQVPPRSTPPRSERPRPSRATQPPWETESPWHSGEPGPPERASRPDEEEEAERTAEGFFTWDER
jgi:uncharacterized membrane-anchored protein